MADRLRVQVKRHCSISPLGLALVFAALGALSLGIATVFAALGAWLILPFAGLEVAPRRGHKCCNEIGRAHV